MNHNVIIQDEKTLRLSSYALDITIPENKEKMNMLISYIEEILYKDTSKGLIESNINGLGLSACQVKKVWEDSSFLKEDKAPQVSCIR